MGAKGQGSKGRFHVRLTGNEPSPIVPSTRVLRPCSTVGSSGEHQYMITNERSASSLPTVLRAAEVAELPKTRLGSVSGVENQLLWADETAAAGVLTVQKGHRLGAHTHRQNHHHLWVLSGAATVLGQEIGPGSYVHVPSGVEHDIDATATEGCTVYYLYIQPA